jgi:hypothetical protein
MTALHAVDADPTGGTFRGLRIFRPSRKLRRSMVRPPRPSVRSCDFPGGGVEYSAPSRPTPETRSLRRAEAGTETELGRGF